MRIAKQEKPYSDLQSVEDWLEYYHDASRSELKAVLKSLGNNWHDIANKNKKRAIEALLA